ncbi:twin-arginine translocase subunit TatC [Leucobacter sp. BZR 635]
MAKEGREKRNRQGRMSLGEHLVELRKRLIIAALGLVAGLVGGWFLVKPVWNLLRDPINELKLQGRDAVLTYSSITEGFDLQIQIALFIAVIITAPIWLYQIWAFLAPGLTRKEKLYGVGFLGAAVPLFLAGIFAAWYVLPNIVRLLSTFQPAEDAFYLSARTYVDFAVKLMLAVGVGFVMPVVLVMLNFVGIIRGKTILKSWRVAILVIVLFAALTTPAADLWSMFLLAVPMIVLYFIAVGISLLHDRRVDKRRAKEFEEYGIDLSEPDLSDYEDEPATSKSDASAKPRKASTDS